MGGARLKDIPEELYLLIYEAPIHLQGSISSVRIYHKIPSVLEYMSLASKYE